MEADRDQRRRQSNDTKQAGISHLCLVLGSLYLGTWWLYRADALVASFIFHSRSWRHRRITRSRTSLDHTADYLNNFNAEASSIRAWRHKLAGNGAFLRTFFHSDMAVLPPGRRHTDRLHCRIQIEVRRLEANTETKVC